MGRQPVQLFAARRAGFDVRFHLAPLVRAGTIEPSVLALLAGTAVYLATFFPFTWRGPPAGFGLLRPLIGELPAIWAIIVLPVITAALVVYGRNIIFRV